MPREPWQALFISLLNVYPGRQVLSGRPLRWGAGEGSEGRQGGAGTIEDRGKRFSLSECCECWEKLRLDEDPTALTSGTWINEETRYLLQIQVPIHG